MSLIKQASVKFFLKFKLLKDFFVIFSINDIAMISTLKATHSSFYRVGAYFEVALKITVYGS